MSADQQASFELSNTEGGHLQSTTEQPTQPTTSSVPFPYSLEPQPPPPSRYPYSSLPSQPSPSTQPPSFQYTPHRVSNYPNVSQGSSYLQQSPVHTQHHGSYPYGHTMGYPLPYSSPSSYTHLNPQGFTSPVARPTPPSRTLRSPMREQISPMRQSHSQSSVASHFSHYGPVSPRDYLSHGGSQFGFEQDVGLPSPNSVHSTYGYAMEQADNGFQGFQDTSQLMPYGYSPGFTDRNTYQSPQVQSPTLYGSNDSRGSWWYLPQGFYPSNLGTPVGHTYPNFPPAVRPEPDSHPAFSPGSELNPSSPTYRRDHGQVRPGLSVLQADPSPPGSRPPPRTNVSTPRPVSSSHAAPSEQTRKAYHPNPPDNRSEWVMWVGNVPSDATHNELWQFFNSSAGDTDSRRSPTSPTVPSERGGVSSVFLISRSNCAFINFESEAHLQSAVARFNGQAIRPADPRCMKLVCRVRKPDDDLKAGVGGQRGMGMHINWVKEKKQKERASNPKGEDKVDGSAPQSRHSVSSETSRSSKPDHSSSSEPKHLSSSGSYSSSTSSFLGKHFPIRYFILKSLNEADLNLSVERGVWATQHHNEGVLDTAYKTSNTVYLIFSANKSGEFFGYAKMAGPIKSGETKVPWTSRSEPMPTSSNDGSNHSLPSEALIPEESPQPDLPRPMAKTLLSPSEHRMTAESPGILTSDEEKYLQDMEESQASRASTSGQTYPRSESPSHAQSAPAGVEQPHGKLSYEMGLRHGTFDLQPMSSALPAQSVDSVDVPGFPTAALSAESKAAVRAQEELGSSLKDAVRDQDGVLRKDTLVTPEERPSPQERSSLSKSIAGGSKSRSDKEFWGDSFRVQWVRTERLSFQRTKHLRNPWNHDKEVKVSRDGTELEPGVGAALIAEWEKLGPASSPLSSVPVREPGNRLEEEEKREE